MDIKEQKEIIGYIQQSAKSTYNLLENLLMWSRLQRDKIILTIEELNLFELSINTVKLLSPSAQRKSINIINNIPEDTFINADENMLSTVLRNLISNAIKFTQKNGTIEIGCVATRHTLSQPHALSLHEIYVKDNGVGISKEIQKKIFNTTNNISTQGTNNETGTGLGLIICKEFVEKHGGKIWLESEVEKGSKFIFTIPKLQ